MKLVIQRVTSASVVVKNETAAAINDGLVVLVGIEKNDGEKELERAAAKVATLRAFEDANGKLNLGVQEVGGAILAISQFTIAGSIRKGRRPSFDRAMAGEQAEPMFDRFVDHLRGYGLTVETGVFGAFMYVHLVNSGPVTLLWSDPET
jgi:D-tyrosyl-tRNA(Tyr) deacylase